MSHFKNFCAKNSAAKNSAVNTRQCLLASTAITAITVTCAVLLSPVACHAQVPPPPTHRTAPWQPPTWRSEINFPGGQTGPNAPAAPWEVDSQRATDATPATDRSQTNLTNLKPPRDIFTQQIPSSQDRFAARPINQGRSPSANGSGFDLQNAISEKFGSGPQQANLDLPSSGSLFDVPRLARFGDSPTQATDDTGVTAAASTMAAETFDGVQNWVQEQTAGFLTSDQSGESDWMQRLSSMTGGADIKKIGGSLAIVLGGYLGLVWLLRKINPAGNQSIPTEVLEVVGNAPLDSRQNLQLVRLGSKLLLMIHGPDGTQPIGEVTDPAEVDHLVALCNGKSRTANSAVSQAVNRHQSNAANSGSLNLSSNQQNNLTQLLSALEQVNRGTSARTFEA